MKKWVKRVIPAILTATMILTSIPGSMQVEAEEQESQASANEAVQLITNYEMTLTEDGKLEDKAGGHNANMVSMGQGDINEGNLIFTGNKSQYIEFPEGTFGDDESFTIDLKFNTSQKAYAWVYNLGARDTADYVFLNPMRSEGNTVFALKQKPAGEKFVMKNNVVTPGADTWATMVFQDNNTANLYINGKLSGSISHGYSVQTIINNAKKDNCIGYLGKSLFDPDPGYVGSISYFRVYDNALDADQVWRNYAEQQGLSDEEKAEMDISELSLEEGEAKGDLDLPATGKNGAAISWTSSHPQIISETGIVTKPAEDTEVTLTASVIYGSIEKTRDFHFMVISNASIVAEAIEQLTIDNADPVVENITLATDLNGASITWESSDTNVITDKAVENEEYAETPAGVVTRGEKDKQVKLTATITLGDISDTKEFDLTVKKKAAQKEYAAYLYVHFNELVVGTSLQQIYFGVSKDGLQWTALNDNAPILESAVGDLGVRDPYIVRSPEGDKFYLIGTDLDIHHPKYGGNWGLMASIGSNALVIWESTDLVNWTESRTADVASGIGAGCAWAPAAIYDETTGEYLVFWSSPLTGLTGDSGHGYIFVSKTRDFVTFTEAELYSDPGINTIDADIYKEGDSYYRLLKESAKGYVYLQSSPKLLDYTEPPVYNIGGRDFTARGMEFHRIENTAPGCLETFRGTYEGPTMFKFSDRNEWCILVDEYGFPTARGYVPFFTNNLDEPNSVKVAADNTYTLTDGAKHGSVIPITQEEYDNLVAKWGVNNEKYAEEKTEAILNYDFEEKVEEGIVKDKAQNNDGQLFGKAAYRYDAEKGSNVLYLDGSEGTYAQLPTGLFDGLDNLTISMDIKAESTQEYHFDFAIGKDINKYMFLKVRPNEIRNAITARGNFLEKEIKLKGNEFLNKWMRVSVVMENHKMYLYVDGEKAGETSGVGVRNISELGENLNAYLGKSFYPDPYFKGSYDNVKIYNRALSAEEIKNEQAEEPEVTEYTASYLAGEGGAISGLSVQKVKEGTATKEVTAVAKEGYSFYRWSDGVTTAKRSDVLKKDLTVIAEFLKDAEPEIKEYTAVYLPGEGGTITGLSVQKVKEGTATKEVTAEAKEGYSFHRWSDGVLTAKRSDVLKKDLTVTAEFVKNAEPEIKEYTVSYLAGEGGTISGMSVQKVKEGSATKEVTAVAKAGYSFRRWSDGVTTAKRSDVMKKDLTVTAEFVMNEEPEAKEYTASYLAGIGGSISGISVQKVKEGTATKEVTAEAKEGYIFRRWSDGVTTAKRRDVLKNNLTVTAEFTKNPVKPDPKTPVKVKLNKSLITLGVGEKFSFKAVVSPLTASQKVTWKSDKKSVVSVSASGKITAKKTGKSTITAVTKNGKKAICKVTVRKAPKKITLKVSKKTLKKGRTYQLKVNFPSKTASYKMRYSSSKKNVASVSSTGKITAKKKGKTTITAKTFNGKKAEIDITVI